MEFSNLKQNKNNLTWLVMISMIVVGILITVYFTHQPFFLPIWEMLK